MVVRDADAADIEQLARLWHDGWHEAHAPIVPAELTRLRTLDSFRHRLHEGLVNVRLMTTGSDPVGFSMLKGTELYQLFVSPRSRGTGAASVLIADAEARLAARGVDRAWLACAIGNERAARFYEKSGWLRVGTMANRVETSAGPYSLDVWRYEKTLTAAPAMQHRGSQSTADAG